MKEASVSNFSDNELTSVLVEERIRPNLRVALAV